MTFFAHERLEAAEHEIGLLREELHRTRQDLLELQAATRAWLNADPTRSSWAPQARAVHALLIVQGASR